MGNMVARLVNNSHRAVFSRIRLDSQVSPICPRFRNEQRVQRRKKEREREESWTVASVDTRFTERRREACRAATTPGVATSLPRGGSVCRVSWKVHLRVVLPAFAPFPSVSFFLSARAAPFSRHTRSKHVTTERNRWKMTSRSLDAITGCHRKW